MNLKLFNSCFTIASLATCVLNNNNTGDWSLGGKVQLPVTNNLSLVATYYNLCSDYISAYDYEIHFFNIDFFRDGELIDSISFEKKFNGKYLGSLANPDLDLDKKLQVISELKPGFRNKMAAIAMADHLSTEEKDAVIAKSEEIFNMAIGYQQPDRSNPVINK